MGVIIFWAVVAGLLVGSVLLERRHRRKLRESADAGTLDVSRTSSSPEAINSPIAAEGLLRGGYPGDPPTFNP